MLKTGALPIASFVLWSLAGSALASGHTLQNARLTLTFGSNANGYPTQNADRLDAITWISSAGTAVSGFVASGGAGCDSDPIEFFGEAYGDGNNSLPYGIINGITSTWSGTTATEGVTRQVKTKTACNIPLDMKTVSIYQLSTAPGLVNALKVTRTFAFVANASAGALRAYVPRLPLTTYPYVIYPNAAGVLQTVNAGECGFNCVTADWNGKWIADDDGHGDGIAVFRKPNAAFPAEVTVDNDDDSRSNASAITLIEPAAGWTGKLTEVEYLCFYDATSWTAAKRAAGTPPKGCQSVPH